LHWTRQFIFPILRFTVDSLAVMSCEYNQKGREEILKHYTKKYVEKANNLRIVAY